MPRNDHNHRGPISATWTNERVDRLKSLVAEGHSYAQIAVMLSDMKVKLTRNTVCGKAHRMGLAGFDRPSHPDRPKALAGQPKWRPTSQAGIDRGRSKSGKPFKSVLEAREPKAPPVARAQYQNAGLNMRKRKFTEGQSITAKIQMAGSGSGSPPKYTPKPAEPNGANRVDILGLKLHHCRSIDDDGWYCGEPKADGSSYCAHHRAIYCHALVTNPQKRADRQTVRLANHF